MILKFDEIKTPIEINNIDSYQLVIENTSFLYKIVQNLNNFDEDNIILYDGKNLDVSKNVLFISDLYNLNPNSKKILTANYNYAENISKSAKLMNRLIDVNSEILEILGEISLEFNNCVTYSDQITISELLEIYNFKFDFDQLNFIQTFLSYLKAISISYNYKVLITMNLQDLVKKDDFQLLCKEINYMNMTLINISSKKSELTFSKTLIIDNDLCEI